MINYFTLNIEDPAWWVNLKIVIDYNTFMVEIGCCQIDHESSYFHVLNITCLHLKAEGYWWYQIQLLETHLGFNQLHLLDLVVFDELKVC